MLDAAIADERPTADDPSAARAARHRQHHARPRRGRAEGPRQSRRSATRTTRRCGARWRFARQGKWPEARDAFRDVEGALGALPLELQRMALKDALRASIEVGDFASAVNRLNDFKTIGVSPELEPAVSVLTGRLAEARRAASRTRLRPIVSPLARTTGRRRRRAGSARSRCAIRSARPASRTSSASSKSSPPPGAATRPRSRRCRRWRGFTPTPTSTAMRSTSCAWRSARFRLAADPQHPAGSGQVLRHAVPRRQGRRAAGDRCARPVLRFPRAHPDRPARRRDDPQARRAAGLGRSARPGRRAAAIPGRQPPAGRRARPGGDAARGDLSDEPQAGQGAGGAARDPHRRPRQRNPRAAADDRGARAVRYRPP